MGDQGWAEWTIHGSTVPWSMQTEQNAYHAAGYRACANQFNGCYLGTALVSRPSGLSKTTWQTATWLPPRADTSSQAKSCYISSTRTIEHCTEHCITHSRGSFHWKRCVQSGCRKITVPVRIDERIGGIIGTPIQRSCTDSALENSAHGQVRVSLPFCQGLQRCNNLCRAVYTRSGSPWGPWNSNLFERCCTDFVDRVPSLKTDCQGSCSNLCGAKSTTSYRTKNRLARQASRDQAAAGVTAAERKFKQTSATEQATLDRTP